MPVGEETVRKLSMPTRGLVVLFLATILAPPVSGAESQERLLERAKQLNQQVLQLYQQGHYAEAIPLAKESLRIREQALGPNHSDVATSLNNLALLLYKAGDYAGAQPLYERALAINEQTLGSNHPDLAVILSNLALLHGTQRQSQSGWSLCRRALAIQDAKIENVFGWTTEAQKVAFLSSIAGAQNGCLSLLHQQLPGERAAVQTGLELVLRRKGIIFDAQSREREALAWRLPAAARQDWQRVAILRTEYARLVLNKPAQMTPAAYQAKLTALQQEIEAVEKRLAEANALVARELKQRTITLQAAAQALPQGAALAEFVRIRDYDFSKNHWAPTSRYLAFVLLPTGEVTLVDLGDAAALEAQVSAVLTAFKRMEEGLDTGKLDRAVTARSQEAVTALSRTLWAPVQQALGKTTHVLLSPDGQVNLVPFAALVDDTGRPLVEQYRLAYVTSGRELVTADSGIKPDSDLVLVANPAYDRTPPTTSAATSPAAARGPARRSRNFQARFAPLPGTAEEAQAIAPLVQAPATRKHIWLGVQATETAVKTSRSPRILHLATHGFFLQDQPQASGTESRGVTIQGGSDMPPGPLPENPLIRSGLAFAGANQAAEAQGDDDGILTALEITGMDLHGTDLVVLSACETGLGEVKNGEGVYGLRRAFALAGAKNLLMSLWPVNDAVAATQMTAFYKNLQTLPPAEALRQAQVATIQELTAKDQALVTPVLWAPFFLQGAQALGQ